MKTVLIIVVLTIVIGGGYYLYQRSGYQATPWETPWPAPAPTPSTSSQPSQGSGGQAGQAPPAMTGGETYTVVMNASGFNPENITIAAGDTVVFKNSDTRTRWPASGLHPTHQLCLGFDALGPIQPGGEYSHIFSEAKDCPMHDHLIPSLRGKIVVTK